MGRVVNPWWGEEKFGRGRAVVFTGGDFPRGSE